MKLRPFPSTLNNRLFLSFVALILLPFFAVQLRSYDQMEALYVNRIGEQSKYQLDQIVGRMEQIKLNLLMISLQLEKEPVIAGVLRPEVGEEDARSAERLLKDMKTFLKSDGAFVELALSDLRGGVYTSADRNVFHEESFAETAGGWLSREGRPPVEWGTEPPFADANDSNNPDVLVLFSAIGSGERAGVLAVSFDYRKWLQDQTNRFLIQQDYYLLDKNGTVLFRTSPDAEPPAAMRDWIGASAGRPAPEPFVDRASSSVLTGRAVASEGWTLAAQFPLDVFFGDIDEVKRQAYGTFGLFTLLFVAITFFIARTVTRPLRLLRKKMSELIRNQFLVHLPTDKYRGEILEMAEAFNRMVRDLNRSIERLKTEERRREAARFQILLQQMNPHFLLNTLNTIKWNAFARGDEATGDICVALGQLLETSLSAEEDLIYFRKELELAEAYVRIQRYRYEQPVVLRYEYDPILDHALVPKFSLQPLVENAIIHGFTGLQGEGVIVVRARREDRTLHIEIEDNGIGLDASRPPEASPRRRSIGLTNIRERLQLLFRGEAGLELVPLERGTLAVLRVPFLISTPYKPDEGGSAHVESAAR